STGIRITSLVQFWTVWLARFGYCWWTGTKAERGLLITFAMLSIIHWTGFGWAFTAEAGSVSRRVRREFPDGKMRRLLMAPFLPGGARGYIFVLFQIISIWVLYAVGMSYFARGGWFGGSFFDRVYQALANQDRFFNVVTALCLQLIIYCGINTALA